MNVLATSFTLEYNSLDIYLAGCRGKNGIHCKNCHNPESWCFDQGMNYELYLNKIKEKNSDFDSLIKNIMIFGGEPLDQDYKELEIFLNSIKEIDKDIWLFTRKPINEVPNFVKEICSYIKCGAYIEELKEENVQYGITLATSNQKIFKKGVDY